jgi:patatin-like phospholipase/acyl hydrolase
VAYCDLLALEGGGVRGIMHCIVLAELERRTGKSCYQLFKRIAGTSVGSIVGAALAMGVPASEIIKFFTKDASVIFSKPWWDISGAWGPKFSLAPLVASLQTLLGNAKLSGCKTDFMAIAFDCHAGDPVKFKSWDIQTDYMLWQICAGSAAAQTYFPAFPLDDMMLIDGGNTSSNAPDVSLFMNSHRKFGAENIRMLSLGTGDSPWDMDWKAMQSPSPLRALAATVKIEFEASSDDVVEDAQAGMGPAYYRIQPPLSTNPGLSDASPATLAMLTEAAQKVTAGPIFVY